MRKNKQERMCRSNRHHLRFVYVLFACQSRGEVTRVVVTNKRESEGLLDKQTSPVYKEDKVVKRERESL